MVHAPRNDCAVLYIPELKVGSLWFHGMVFKKCNALHLQRGHAMSAKFRRAISDAKQFVLAELFSLYFLLIFKLNQALKLT